MIPQRLDRTAIERFLDAACGRLEGEWLLVGGAVAAVWFSPDRVTEDIDMIGMGGTMTERMQLMDLATELGLPIETVNSAADFFVRRVPDWQSSLEVLRRGDHVTVYRPTPTLFLLLKSRRLSEVDLGDCLALLQFCRHNGLAVDTARIVGALQVMSPTDDTALALRREALARALSR